VTFSAACKTQLYNAFFGTTKSTVIGKSKPHWAAALRSALRPILEEKLRYKAPWRI
jgi:hypothetical protein